MRNGLEVADLHLSVTTAAVVRIDLWQRPAGHIILGHGWGHRQGHGQGHGRGHGRGPSRSRSGYSQGHGWDYGLLLLNVTR